MISKYGLYVPAGPTHVTRLVVIGVAIAIGIAIDLLFRSR